MPGDYERAGAKRRNNHKRQRALYLHPKITSQIPMANTLAHLIHAMGRSRKVQNQNTSHRCPEWSCVQRAPRRTLPGPPPQTHKSPQIPPNEFRKHHLHPPPNNLRARPTLRISRPSTLRARNRTLQYSRPRRSQYCTKPSQKAM